MDSGEISEWKEDPVLTFPVAKWEISTQEHQSFPLNIQVSSPLACNDIQSQKIL
jgi:hypothetical protein